MPSRRRKSARAKLAALSDPSSPFSTTTSADSATPSRFTRFRASISRATATTTTTDDEKNNNNTTTNNNKSTTSRRRQRTRKNERSAPVPLDSPIAKTTTTTTTAITTPEPPTDPFPWLWRCHCCLSIHRLSCTRRCLECSHRICPARDSTREPRRRATTTTNTDNDTNDDTNDDTKDDTNIEERKRLPLPPRPNRKAPKRPGKCRVVFDYAGWEAYNEWRRAIRPPTQTVTVPTTPLFPYPVSTRTRTHKIVSITGDRMALFVGRRHDCWVHCDYPSECNHEAFRALARYGLGDGAAYSAQVAIGQAYHYRQGEEEGDEKTKEKKKKRIRGQEDDDEEKDGVVDIEDIYSDNNGNDENENNNDNDDDYNLRPPLPLLTSAKDTSSFALIMPDPNPIPRPKTPAQLRHSRRKLAQLTGHAVFAPTDPDPDPESGYDSGYDDSSLDPGDLLTAPDLLAAELDPLPEPMGPDHRLPSPSRETFYLDGTDLAPEYAKPPEYEYEDVEDDEDGDDEYGDGHVGMVGGGSEKGSVASGGDDESMMDGGGER